MIHMRLLSMLDYYNLLSIIQGKYGIQAQTQSNRKNRLHAYLTFFFPFISIYLPIRMRINFVVNAAHCLYLCLGNYFYLCFDDLSLILRKPGPGRAESHIASPSVRIILHRYHLTESSLQDFCTLTIEFLTVGTSLRNTSYCSFQAFL